MIEERDLLVFENEEGQEITLELLEYFEFEDEEYALLVDATECQDEACDDCDCASHGEEMEIIVMKVIVDGDNEEFVPVEDEKLDAIVEYLEESYADEDDYDDEDEDDDE